MEGWIHRWTNGWMGGQVATEWIAITQGSGRRETLAWRLRVSPMEPHSLGLIPAVSTLNTVLWGCKGLVFSMYDVSKSRAAVRMM